MSENVLFNDVEGLRQFRETEGDNVDNLANDLAKLITEEDGETLIKNYEIFIENYNKELISPTGENLRKLNAMKPNIEKIITKIFDYKKEKMVAGFKYTLYIAVLVAIIVGALLVILWIPLVILAFLSETYISHKKWYGTLSLGDRFRRSLYGPFYGIFLIFRRVNSDYF